MRLYLATLAILVYLVFVFCVRSWLHDQRTGSSGLRSVHALPGLFFTAGAVFLLAAPPLTALELDQLWFAPSIPTDLIGALLTIAGAIGTWCAQSTMGDSWRVGVAEREHTPLVTHGLFRAIRNPIFTFMLTSAAGLAVWLPVSSTAAAFCLLWIGVELQVRRVEEPHLLRVHGDRYRVYCEEVGRFLPGLGRSRRSPRRSSTTAAPVR